MTDDQLIDTLTATILQKSADTQLFIVGISGLDASGKSQVTATITNQLKNQGKNVLSLSGDSFQFPRAYKEDFQEETWAQQHMHRTINFAKMKTELLEPLQTLPTSLPLDVVDYDTKEQIRTDVSLQYPLIVVLESIYLFSQELSRYFNYKIFLDISVEESLKRAKTRPRDLELYGGETGVEKKYTTKNFPGYLEFDRLENPKQYADIVVDNTDWQNPVISSD